LPFQNQKGTVTALLQIFSTQGANIPDPVRVLINTPEPDQRGISLDIPGTLVDMLPDPSRDRFFVIRQDRNQVLVFDGTNYNQIAVLRTLNTPTQLAITYDQRWLLVGTNTGMTASVDPYGRIVAATQRKFRTALVAPYGLLSGTTFYTRHGDWFAYLCAIISIGAIIARFLFRKQIPQS